MKAESFCRLLGDIDPAYIEELEVQMRKTRHRTTRFIAAAACFAVIFTMSIFAIKSQNGGSTGRLQEQPGIVPEQTGDDEGTTQGRDDTYTIYLEEVTLNELDYQMDSARLWQNPELYHGERWDWDKITEYYGRDLTPPYIPEGLSPAYGNGSAEFILKSDDGTVAEDTVWLGYYHDYYEDGSPKLTEGVNATKGISVTISKLGILGCCIYILPENEVRTTDIAGTSVTFGYRPMPYGPYDPDSHEPSGHYDLYTAEFKLDGAEYELVSHQIELEEFVKTVGSIITGEEVNVGTDPHPSRLV